MQRIFQCLALGGLLLALAACSHKTSNAPLAFVPADTPYVLANLKPLDSDTQAAMLDAFNKQFQSNLAQMNMLTSMLDADDDAHTIGLLHAIISEYDGVETVQQLAAKEGVDLRGLGAFYGVGLSPVLRLPLTDPAKFSALVGRLQKGSGQPLEQATAGKLDYQSLNLGNSKLQALIAVEDKQAVIALAPMDADEALVRRILGVDRPAKSARDEQRLETLAKANDYTPYALGYIDTTRLPVLLTDASDPMLKALAHGDEGQVMPADCRVDLARIAARVPMISVGYTTLSAKHMAGRYDVQLAPDIVKAFANVQPAVPGLGSDTHAPFDLTLALPMDTIHSFLSAQVKAVAAKPFTCGALAKLNDGFASLGNMLPNAKVPPAGDLRGLRVSIDNITHAATGSVPTVRGRVLIASADSASLVAVAKNFVASLASVNLTNDATPVKLPAELTAMAKQPGWAAMNDNALAIGIGTGEDAKLGAMLTAPMGKPGELLSGKVDGQMYGQYVEIMAERTTKSMDELEKTVKDPKQLETIKKLRANTANSLESTRASVAKIKQMNFAARMGKHGLIITSTVDMR